MRIKHARQITIFDQYEMTLAGFVGAAVLYLPSLRHPTLSLTHWLGAIVGFAVTWVWSQFATGSLSKWDRSRIRTGLVFRALFRFLKL